MMIRYWLNKPYLAIAATIFVCVLLFSPANELPTDTPGWINDKVAHGIVFAGLSFLWVQCLRRPWLVILLLVFFAFFTEIVQYLLPVSFRRSLDLYDVLADLAGVLAGLVISRLFERVFF